MSERSGPEAPPAFPGSFQAFGSRPGQLVLALFKRVAVAF